MRQETILQMQCVDYLSMYCKQRFVFFSIPNEGALFGAGENRNKMYSKMMMLKKMGMLPGVFDLIILKDSKVYFIEFKSPKGKLTDNQKIFRNLIEKTGFENNMVIDNFGDFVKLMKTWEIVNDKK